MQTDEWGVANRSDESVLQVHRVLRAGSPPADTQSFQ
jgi:hypothetical protein